MRSSNLSLKRLKKQFSANLTVDVKCPTCGEDLTIKHGRNGNFVACTSYPECKFTSNYERLEDGSFKLVPKEEDKPSGIECEKCGKELVFKKNTRFGKVLACPGYPECKKNIKNYVELPGGEIKVLSAGEDIGTPCPKCGSGLSIKGGRNGMFIGCSKYPDCDFTGNMEVNEKGR